MHHRNTDDSRQSTVGERATCRTLFGDLQNYDLYSMFLALASNNVTDILLHQVWACTTDSCSCEVLRHGFSSYPGCIDEYHKRRRAVAASIAPAQMCEIFTKGFDRLKPEPCDARHFVRKVAIVQTRTEVWPPVFRVVATDTISLLSPYFY